MPESAMLKTRPFFVAWLEDKAKRRPKRKILAMTPSGESRWVSRPCWSMVRKKRTQLDQSTRRKLETLYRETRRYPTRDEKLQLAIETGLHDEVIKNWFNNRRSKDRRA